MQPYKLFILSLLGWALCPARHGQADDFGGELTGNQTVVLHEDGTCVNFVCTHNSTDVIVFRINGMTLKQLNSNDAQFIVIEGTNPLTLTICLNSTRFNGTKIECQKEDGTIIGPVFLFIQGMLGVVSDLNITEGNGTFFAVWEEPFTLDLTESDNITYFVEVFSNMNGSLLSTTTGLVETEYQLPFDPCNVTIVITPYNGAGRGEATNISRSCPPSPPTGHNSTTISGEQSTVATTGDDDVGDGDIVGPVIGGVATAVVVLVVAGIGIAVCCCKNINSDKNKGNSKEPESLPLVLESNPSTPVASQDTPPRIQTAVSMEDLGSGDGSLNNWTGAGTSSILCREGVMSSKESLQSSIGDDGDELIQPNVAVSEGVPPPPSTSVESLQLDGAVADMPKEKIEPAQSNEAEANTSEDVPPPLSVKSPQLDGAEADTPKEKIEPAQSNETNAEEMPPRDQLPKNKLAPPVPEESSPQTQTEVMILPHRRVLETPNLEMSSSDLPTKATNLSKESAPKEDLESAVSESTRKGTANSEFTIIRKSSNPEQLPNDTNVDVAKSEYKSECYNTGTIPPPIQVKQKDKWQQTTNRSVSRQPRGKPTLKKQRGEDEKTSSQVRDLVPIIDKLTPFSWPVEQNHNIISCDTSPNGQQQPQDTLSLVIESTSGEQGETSAHGGQGETGTRGGQGETGTHDGQGETGTHDGQGETGTCGGQGETDGDDKPLEDTTETTTAHSESD